MSNGIDEKVVSLKFDNSKFEDNAQQSLETLAKLKASLDFNNFQNSKGLDKLNTVIKNTDFSVMERGIDNISSKFSIMGIAGIRVISNLTDSVMGLGKKLISFVPGQIKSGGISRSLKLEQAKFQLEGLGKVWDQNSKGFVTGMRTMKDAVLDAISTTAYGIGEAANVASQLSASGVKVSEMTDKLRAVAGVAAMTGSSFEDIGRIFIQTAGNGRLMGKQLLELSQRGLNVAKTMADYINNTKGAKEELLKHAVAIGKWNKNIERYAASTKTTEADIRTLASEGVLSFELFSTVMEKAFGEHAAKANDTYTGSLMNMKAAFSRIGSEVATTQLVNLKYIFNGIREAVYNVLYVIFPFIEKINELSVILSQKLYTALEKINDKMNVNRDRLKKWSQEQAIFTNNAEGIWAKFTGKVKESSEEIQAASDKTAQKQQVNQRKIAKAHKDTSNTIKVTSKELKAAMDIWYKGTYGDGEDRRRNLKKVGLSYKHVQRAVNELVRVDYNLKKANIEVTNTEKKRQKVVKNMSKSAAQAAKATKVVTKEVVAAKESTYGWGDAIKSTFRGFGNVAKYVYKLLKPIGTAFKEVFYPERSSMKNGILNAAKQFEAFTSKLKPSKETLSNIKDTFKGIFDVMVLVKDAAVALLSAIFPMTKTAGSLGSVIVSITGGMGRLLSTFVKFVRESKVIQTVSSGIGKAVHFVVNLIKNISTIARTFVNYTTKHLTKGIKKLFDVLGKGGKTVKSFGKDLLKWPIKYLKEFGNKISDVSKWTESKFARALDKYAVPALKRFRDRIKDGVDWMRKFSDEHEIFRKLKNISGSAFDSVKMGAEKTFSKVKELFSTIRNSEFISALKDKFKELGIVLKDLGDVIITKLVDKFKQLENYFKDIHFASRIKDSFTDMLDSAIEFGKGFKKSLEPVEDAKKTVESVKKSLDPSFLSTYAGQLGKFNTNFAKNSPITQDLPGHDQKPNDAYKNLIQFLKDIRDAYESSGVPQVINEIKKKIHETFSNSEWDLDKAIDRGLGITKIVATLKLVKQSESIVRSTQGFMKSLGGIFDAAASTISSFGYLGTELGNASKAFKKHMKFESLKAFAVAVALIAASVYILAKLSVSEIERGGAAVAAIAGLMMLVLHFVSNPNLDDSKLKAAGIAFASMGGSMVMIAAAAKIFGSMNGGELLKAGVGLAAFVGIFIATAKLLKKDPVSMMSFAALALGVTLLIPAIKIMSKMKFSTLARGGAAIFAFVVMIGLAARAAGQNKGGFAAFLGLSAAVATLVPAIVILSMLPMEKSLKAAATLSLILIALGRAIKISNSGSGTLNVAFAFAVSAMIGSLTVSLIALSLVPFEKLMKSVVALGAVMGALAAATHYMKDAKADLGLIVVVLGAMSGMVYIMGTVNSETAAVNMAAMSGLLLSLTAVCEILKKGTMTFGAAARTLGIISMWLVGIVAVILALQTVLGYIAENTNIEKYMKRGIKIAGLIGEFIGAFVGGMAGGFAMYGLAALTKALSDFATGMQPFFDFAKNIDSDVVKGVKNLGEAVLFLTGASILNKLNSGPINSWYGGGMVEFANDLGRLMESLSKIDFSKAPTEEETAGVSAAIKGLGEAAAAIPSTGGIRKVIFGIKDLSNFGEEVGHFIASMYFWKFPADTFTDTDFENITKVSDAITALGEAAQAIPESTTFGNTSWKQIFLGMRDISDFGNELVQFMPQLNLAIKAIVGAKEDPSYFTTDNLDKVTAVADVIGALAEAANKVPKNLTLDSLNALFSGTKDLNAFAEGLTAIGDIMPELISASANLNKTNVGQITMMANAITALAESAKAVKEAGTKSGGIGKDTVDMVNRMANFTEKLPEFATKFKTFAEEASKIKTADLTAANNVSTAFKALADAYKALYDSKAFGSGSGDISSKISSLGEAVKSYAENVNGLEVGNIEKNTQAVAKSIGDVGQAMSEKTSDFRDTAKTSVSEYANGIADSGATETAKTNAAALRKAVIDVLKGNEYSQYKTTGKNSALNYANGLIGGKGPVSSAGKTIGSAGANGAKSADFYGAGQSGAQGFASGLNSMVGTVSSAGASLGKTAYEAAKKYLDINSPSRKFIALGHSVNEGFVLGIKKYSNLVYKEAINSGKKAVAGARTGAEHIIDEITDPTITPVLDLTQLKRGVGQMDGMLANTNPRINPQFVDNSLNRQNGSLDIDKLAAKLEKFAESAPNNTPANVYTIGDVTVDVSKLEDVTTLNDFVDIVRQAKAFR